MKFEVSYLPVPVRPDAGSCRVLSGKEIKNRSTHRPARQHVGQEATKTTKKKKMTTEICSCSIHGACGD
jgi:hypothetical protein